MKYVYNDGGRLKAGYKGTAGDCVVRAVCIAAELDYETVYQKLSHGMATQRASKHKAHNKKDASRGVSTKRKWFKDFMASIGWEWNATMYIGSGCQVHLDAADLPKGRIIARVSRHYVAVIDGVVHDNHDCTRGGKRCVYGYWSKIEA